MPKPVRPPVKQLDIASSRPQERNLLPHEVEVVQKELASLAVIQAYHGELLGEAMNQAAETYHDNAPAEVVRDDQEVLMRRAKPLLHMLKHHVIIPYPETDDPNVQIGSRVTIKIENLDETFKVDIVGFRPNNPDEEEGVDMLSYEAPLAEALLDHTAGDVVVFGERRVPHHIVEVDQTAIADRHRV